MPQTNECDTQHRRRKHFVRRPRHKARRISLATRAPRFPVWRLSTYITIVFCQARLLEPRKGVWPVAKYLFSNVIEHTGIGITVSYLETLPYYKKKSTSVSSLVWFSWCYAVMTSMKYAIDTVANFDERVMSGGMIMDILIESIV